jgi:hypothetical protein
LVIIDTSDGSERAEVAKDARCDVVCRHPAPLRECPCDAIRRFPAGDDAVAPVDVIGGRSCSRTRVVVQENLLVDHDERSVQAVSFDYLRAEWKVGPRAVPPCRMAGCVLHAHRRNRQQHQRNRQQRAATHCVGDRRAHRGGLW